MEQQHHVPERVVGGGRCQSSCCRWDRKRCDKTTRSRKRRSTAQGTVPRAD